MAEYSNKRKKLADLDDLSREELLGKLKRLVGGGLASARLNNELDEITYPDSEELKDGYQLRFVGKDYARLQAGLATETVVVPNVEHNQKPENKDSQNVFITGDNLDALKHLENSYTGQVDVIYIDPPYNTGTDGFVYQDNFKFSDDDLKLKLGLSDKELGRIRSLNGKSSHSAWLTFMYPRLVIAKRLLKDSGVIFISIDDNEQANLKIMCDEIFTETNFVGNIAWESKTKSQNTETAYDKLQPKVEHIFCYTKRNHRRFNLIQRGKKEYPLTDEQGVYREYPLEVMNATGMRGRQSMVFDIKGILPPAGKQWKLGRDQVATYETSGNLLVRNGKIILKMRPADEKQEQTDPFWGFFGKEIGTAESAKKELTEILGGTHGFETVKPVDLIKRLLFHASSKESIIVDFFGGSGTTAEAVMQLNDDDSGSRKFIIIQLDELCDPNTQSGKVAIEAGYKTIDEIASKRIVNAGLKINSTGNQVRFDGGFKHYVLKTPGMQTLDKIETFEPGLVVHEDMVTPFAGTELGVVGGSDGTKTLLTTWLLDDGYKFDDSYEVMTFAGSKAYRADARLYVIDQGWSTASTKELLNQIGTNKLSINTLVVYPYSFDFATLRELKVNIRANLDEDHGVELVERY